MKRLYTLLLAVVATLTMAAQGWPEQYEGVMLQGFYWDSYTQSQWTKLEKQADEFAQYFTLVWLPQSANCGGTSMGYDDLYWFPGHYDSSFGTEQELRSLINTFKAKGIGTIADVVINHRRNVSNWVDFPAETYNGVTYQLVSTDICADDDKYKEGNTWVYPTKDWATQNNYQLSSNNDTGEGWGGMRDLDHKSENVQKNVKAYLKMLLNDLGYIGFRYDMVKGYSATYTKMYNEDSQPQFSVGECWDSSNTIRNWINGTEKTSAAFDFQFRYTVRNAANNGNWSRLSLQNEGNWPLISNNYESGNYKQWAVTFVENHDTEKRPNDNQDPLKKDTLAANAYLLAMPGTPCIFLTHWRDCKQSIKAMIDVRRAAGIQNTSTYTGVVTNQQQYAAYSSDGSKSKLLVVVGQTGLYTPADSWVKVLSGHHFAYYLDKGANTAWVDLASGKFEGKQQATLTAVTATAGAQLVYTTDGSTPTASSTKVASGTKIDIEEAMTLKVGLLIGSTVSGIVTRNYTFADPSEKRTINIYVNTDKVGWNAVNFWSWGGDDTHAPAKGGWPGDKITTTTTIDGMQWFSKSFTINNDEDFVNFVFSTGSGSPQTVDVENVSTTKFFEISDQKSGTKHLVNDVTDQHTAGISDLKSDPRQPTGKIYNLGGQQVNRIGQRGIYIVNGKKYVR